MATAWPARTSCLRAVRRHRLHVDRHLPNTAHSAGRVGRTPFAPAALTPLNRAGAYLGQIHAILEEKASSMGALRFYAWEDGGPPSPSVRPQNTSARSVSDAWAQPGDHIDRHGASVLQVSEEKHARAASTMGSDKVFWHCRGRRSEQCRSAWHHFDHGMPLSLRCSPPIINMDLPSSTADGTARAAGSFCLMMLISSAASPVHANSSCVAGQPRTAADAE